MDDQSSISFLIYHAASPCTVSSSGSSSVTCSCSSCMCRTLRVCCDGFFFLVGVWWVFSFPAWVLRIMLYSVLFFLHNWHVKFCVLHMLRWLLIKGWPHLKHVVFSLLLVLVLLVVWIVFVVIGYVSCFWCMQQLTSWYDLNEPLISPVGWLDLSPCLLQFLILVVVFGPQIVSTFGWMCYSCLRWINPLLDLFPGL